MTRHRPDPMLRCVVTACLLAAGVAAVATATSSAADPGANGERALRVRSVPVEASDLAFDPFSNTLFASVGATGSTGNAVQPIDPVSGALAAPIFVGSEPRKMALSDDGSALYVALEGAGAIRRVSLPDRTAGLQWSLGSGVNGQFRAIDLEVMPGQPETVAVTERSSSGYPDRLVVFDAGVARSQISPAHLTPAVIEFSTADPNRLYGATRGISPPTTYWVQVGPSGVTTVDTARDFMRGVDPAYEQGLLFDGTQVIDAEARTVVAAMVVSARYGLVVPDQAHDRVYGLDELRDYTTGLRRLLLRVFEATSYTELMTFDLTHTAPGPYDVDFVHSFVGLGDGRFAFALADRVVLVDIDAPPDASGEYTPLTPSRVLDTRTGIGTDGVVGPVGTGGSIRVQISGRAGVPHQAVDAVAVNATVSEPTAASFLTIWPSGGPRPNISNLNYTAGTTRANLVTVALGGDGALDVYNHNGSTHVVLDVVGFYSTVDGPVGGRFKPVTPARAFDTRSGIGGVPVRPLSPGETLAFNVLGSGDVPSDGATAVALNVTATNTTTSGYLTVWPAGVEQPNASNLNFVADSSVPNLVIVGVPPSGVVNFFNYAGQTDVVVDVAGYYTSERSGGAGRFVSVAPYRLLDTREFSPFDPPGLVPPGNGIVTTGEADEPYSAYIMNVTATGTVGDGYITVHPWPGEIPYASNVNYADGETVANLAIARTGPGVGFANENGATHIIADVFGAFTKG